MITTNNQQNLNKKKLAISRIQVKETKKQQEEQWYRKFGSFLLSFVNGHKDFAHTLGIGGLSILVFASTLSSIADPAPNALPSGLHDTVGIAGVKVNGNTMNVNANEVRSIANWQTFNVGSQATVNFNLPDSSSAILNRVTGGSASEIFGRINSNGNVFLVNHGGIFFSQSAQVNVGSLFASTLGISNKDFLSGNLVFSQTGDAPASVINAGRITTKKGGSVTLAGAAVRNDGTINATAGKVNLTVGETISVPIADGVTMDVVVNEALIQGVEGVQEALVNTGTINAQGGLIKAQANLMDNVYQNAINNQGTLRATSLKVGTGTKAGTIELIASGEGKNATISNSGLINANNITLTAGGDIKISDNNYGGVKTLVQASQGLIDITSSNGNVYIEDKVSNNGGSTYIHSGKDVVINDTTSALSNLVSATNQGEVSISSNSNVINKDIVSTQSGDITITGNFTNSGKIQTNAGDISTRGYVNNYGTGVLQTSTGNINMLGNLDNAGIIRTNTGDINLSNINASEYTFIGNFGNENVDLFNNSNLQINNTGSIVATKGNIDVISTNTLNTSDNTNFTTEGAANLSIDQSVQLSNQGLISAGKSLSVGALANLNTGDDSSMLSTQNNLAIKQSIQVQNTGKILVGGDLTVGVSANLSTGTDSVLASNTVNNLSTSQNIQVQNVGTISAKGDVNLGALNNLSLGEDSDISSGNNVFSAETNIQASNAGNLFVGGDLNITTMDAINLGSNSIIASKDLASFTAGANIQTQDLPDTGKTSLVVGDVNVVTSPIINNNGIILAPVIEFTTYPVTGPIPYQFPVVDTGNGSIALPPGGTIVLN